MTGTRAAPGVSAVTVTVEECAQTVAHTLEPVLGSIEEWRGRVAGFVAAANGVLSRERLDAFIDGLVLPQLSRDGIAIGAGFVAAPDFLSDAAWHLAWWLGTGNTFGLGGDGPSVRRLEAIEDPSAESFRDYTSLEWWRVPVATGVPHITGPYVDYLCTDDYTLTLTVPVSFAGAVVGVVGADIYVHKLERILLPALRAIGLPTTLVNASGRIIVSTDPHRPTGSLYRADGLAPLLPRLGEAPAALPGLRLHACGDTGLALLVETP